MSDIAGNPAKPTGPAGEKMLERMNVSHKPLRDWGLSFVNWKEGMYILDVGCGGGATIRDMLGYSANSHINGIDYSPISVKMACQTNQKDLYKQVFISQGDVTDLPYGDNLYDLVTAVETIYFWPDLSKALQEIHRVLKPGGLFLILCEGSNPNTPRPNIDGHFVVYEPQTLKAQLKAEGFHRTAFEKGQGEYIAVWGCKQ